MFPIQFHNISHRFGATSVLRNVSADIAPNAITALIGRSGSGKSTLLQMVNGMIVPTSGEIKLFGHAIDYAHITDVRRGIGYAVQGTGLFPHMTIFDNIALLGRVTKMPAHDVAARVQHLMQLVGLDLSFQKKYPHQLSGGEQQRVGLCRAMLLNPPIFLLDEPFGALDPATRGEIHREVLSLQQQEPRTMLFVTHDMAEAETLADWILELDRGEVKSFLKR